MSKYFGTEIEPILKEIHDTLWEIEARDITEPYGYSEEVITYAFKIFASVCMDKLFANQEAADLPLEDQLLQVERMGEDMKEFMMKHLDVDTTEFYRTSEEV